MSIALYLLPNNGRHPDRPPARAHSGLWYDKFFAHWDGMPAPNATELPKVKPHEPDGDRGGKARWVGASTTGSDGSVRSVCRCWADLCGR